MNGMIKRIALAGAVVGSLTGITASLGGAKALTVAPVPTSDAAAADVMAVQYYPYGYRRYRRPYPRYGYGRFYRGPAGVYNCGPYRYHTHLQRKACR